jgi:hypothetical protein
MELFEWIDRTFSWAGWEAIGAIGAVGALWFAIWASGTATREARARDVATLKALLTSIASASVNTKALISVIEQSPDDRLVATTSAIRRNFTSLDDALADAPLYQLPTTSAVVALTGARASLGTINQILSYLEQGHRSYVPELTLILEQLNHYASLVAENVVRMGGGLDEEDVDDVRPWLQAMENKVHPIRAFFGRRNKG